MFVQTHLAQENACKHSLPTARRLCTHLHSGACPGLGLEEGVEEPSTRISFRSVFLLPLTLPFSHKSTQAGVLKEDWGEGNVEVSARCSSPGAPPPPPHSQAWLLPLPPRARFGAEQYIPVARPALPPPSFPFSPPPVQGPERAPAVNSPGTPLGAGGRARSPPPDPAPPHPAQAVASAAAESPAPFSAAESLPRLAEPSPSAASRAASLQVPEAPSRD